jgi:NAD(P)-dependent dehydrogenase (short-subunit alcohol dehydrogenase family)
MRHTPARPTVVVTGGSAGLGRAIVQAYAEQGARVAILARGGAGLDAARADALSRGAEQALAVRLDVADSAAVEAAADQAEQELGPIDVWVNCAMTSVFATVMDTEPDEYRRVMDVIFIGYVNGTRSALRRMLPRDRGAVVQIGSTLAYRGIPAQSAYCAAKHAIQGFDDSLRAELFDRGSRIRVSEVQMPALNTPQFGWVRTRLPRHPQPVPPIYQPEVAAKAVLWAADHGVREVNVGASTIATRLANGFVPGLLDRYLGRHGIDSQQTDEPVDHATWQDNLDTPRDDDADHGAHGIFDRQAKSSSLALTAVTHKPALAAGAGGVAALAALAGRRLAR